jgi:outer membrane protein assembly factor BamB
VNPYRWELERWENVYLDPYYEKGHYYIFSENWDTHQSFLTKISEVDGKVVYSIPFKTNVDLDLRRSSSTFSDHNRLMFVEGNFIHQFNLNTGQLIATDTFSNFIWNFQWTKEHLTACSYKKDLSTFKYYEIVYENGHYKEKLIHEEYQDNQNNTFGNGGAPPIYANGKWLMTYFTSVRGTGECKNIIIIKDAVNTEKVSIGYDNNTGSCLAGPLLVDDSTMYVYCVDKLFAFDRNTQTIKWSTDIIGSGLNKIVGDFIYIASALSIEKMAIVNKHTGEKTVIDSRSAWSGQSIGDYLCWTQGEFYKFNTVTRKFEFVPTDEKADQGYWEYSVGVSPHSKLLFDMKRWVCYPF